MKVNMTNGFCRERYQITMKRFQTHLAYELYLLYKNVIDNTFFSYIKIAGETCRWAAIICPEGLLRTNINYRKLSKIVWQ